MTMDKASTRPGSLLERGRDFLFADALREPHHQPPREPHEEQHSAPRCDSRENTGSDPSRGRRVYTHSLSAPFQFL